MAASPTKIQAPAAPEVERTQRADARRNRERVLAAARGQFAANGLDAQIDDIARAADVGVGTVYRHFPTKEALLEALAADRFLRLAEWAREAFETPDGWEGLCDFLRRSAELGANDRLLSEAMAERDAFQGAQHEKEELMEATAALVERAQATGELRPEIGAQDIAMLMCGLGRATGPGSFDHAMSWERYLEIIIAGLRAPASQPLP
jgi:AcrR family transcriptional regulator